MLKILLSGTERFIKGVDHTNKLKEPNPRYPSSCAKYSAALFITLLLKPLYTKDLRRWRLSRADRSNSVAVGSNAIKLKRNFLLSHLES